MTKQCSNCKWVRAESYHPKTHKETDWRIHYRTNGGIESYCSYDSNMNGVKATDCCSKWEYFEHIEPVFGYVHKPIGNENHLTEIPVSIKEAQGEYKRFSPAYDNLKGAVL